MPTSTPRARVLVVDDELPLAMVLKRVLEDEHEVLVASSAEEALELIFTDGDFDVVLCDVLMPGTSGVDLFGELSMQRPGAGAACRLHDWRRIHGTRCRIPGGRFQSRGSRNRSIWASCADWSGI